VKLEAAWSLVLFPCMLQPRLKLRVEGQGEGRDQSGGAVLHRDGRISQEVKDTLTNVSDH
jgi:hypothetical protein